MNKYLDYTGLTTLVNKIKELIPTVFSGSGTNHAPGLVPDPGSTQGNTKYLCEDGTWAVPAGSGAQQQADWNQTDNTAVDYIKNKPTIPTVPTNISAFTNDAGYLTGHQDISGKEDNSNKVTSLSSQSTDTQYPSAKCVYDALNSGLKVVTVSSAAAMSIDADKVTVVSGDVGTATITLTVPNDNNAHVWDILMTTDNTVAVTLAMSDIGTILYPDGYVLNADTVYEINVIGTNGTYYLRYGEFVTA